MPKLKTTTTLYLAAIFLVNISILGAVLLFNQAKLKITKKQEIFTVDFKLANVNKELHHAITDLLILSESTPILNYWSNNEAKENIKITIENNFLSFVSNYQTYDQIRIIDTNGMEIIRVNYNNSNPIIIEPEQLQNKKNRYYFFESIALKKGDIYMSPLDLNVENGAIEQPLKPIIRLATPIYDTKNTKQGIIIINYLANPLLQEVSSNNELNEKTLLINSKGYFFKGFKPDEEWAFMYHDQEQFTLENYVGDYQDSILLHSKHQFETNLGLFTSSKVRLETNPLTLQSIDQPINNAERKIYNKAKYWSIINFIPKHKLYKENRMRLLITLFALIVINLIAYFIYKKIQLINRQKQNAYLDLEHSRNEFKKLNASKDRLLTILAHDLKNPFNSMIGFSEILLRKYDKYDDKKRYELISIISNGINSTYQLLDNLLLWTKSQTNQITYNPKYFNAQKLASVVVDECSMQSNGKGIKLVNKISDDVQIFGDYYMLTIAIRNLVSNAVKFSFEKGLIELSAKENNSAYTVSVKDYGMGMDKQIKDQIFTKNNLQLTSTNGTANEKGTGLGLMLCKEFVELHKGKIWVESAVGKGSTFSFSIPKN